MAVDRRAFLGSAAASIVAASIPQQIFGQGTHTALPSVVPAWEPGYLHIHHISTGRGSCAFLVLPDATTLMIDAGSVITGFHPEADKYLINPRPNGSLRPGQWMAQYTQEVLAGIGRKEIDYFVLTHLHDDHMGQVWPGNYTASPKSTLGEYQLGGIMDVAEVLPVRKVIDRCYPDYSYPAPIKDEQSVNYQAFVHSLPKRGAVAERFKAGAKNQIALLRDPQRYSNFEIRNLASNGDVWTGEGDQVQSHFPPIASLNAGDLPTENKCSLAIRLRYGNFTYFSAGDQDHETRYGRLPWGDIESLTAKAAGKVQVAVADHHGYMDADGPDWVRALQPKVFVINGWDSAHPTIVSLANMLSKDLYPGPRLVFSTAIKPEDAIAVRRISEMASQNGHVIFRVPPKGESFDIFVRDSAVANGKVIAHFANLQCT